MPTFTRFGPGHLAAMITIALAAFGLARIARHERARAYVRWSLVLVLAGAIVAYFVTEGLRGTLTGLDFLPFHLSDFAVFLSIFALVVLRQRAAELLYFMSISALFAIVTPDLDRGFGDVLTLVFFTLHGATVASASTLTFGFGLAPQRGAVVRAFVFTNVYAMVVAVMNVLLGTNFLYLRRKPSQPSLLDWLGDWPWYILSAEVIAVVLYSLAHVPFRRRA